MKLYVLKERNFDRASKSFVNLDIETDIRLIMDPIIMFMHMRVIYEI